MARPQKSAQPKLVGEKPAYQKVIRDKAFAVRLNQACDNHPRARPYYSGRLVWVKEEMKAKFGVELALESVRKWFAGEARPRPDKMKLLAQFLGVDEAWLSLGLSPEAQPSEKAARNVRAGGAINIVVGALQLAGGHLAFPQTPDGKVHLYAIMDGQQFSLHVTAAEQTEKGVYRFVVPIEAEPLTILGFVQYEQTAFDLLEMPFEKVKQHGTLKGDYYELKVRETEGAYASGKDVWRIADLRNLRR